MAYIERQVAASTDDAGHVYEGAGSWDLAEVYNGVGKDDDNADNDFGARFLNIPIPQGATILKAELRLYFRNYTGYNLNARLEGEDADDTVAFTDEVNYNARPRTTAKVDWDRNISDPPSWLLPPKWILDDLPDIKSIIQEIVNRPGWESGKSMVIFAMNKGERNTIAFEAYDYHPGVYAPKLYIEYAVPGIIMRQG